MPRFHVEEVRKGRLALSDAEARHAGKARRLSVGDPAAAFDGRGTEGTGHVVGVSPRRVEIEIEQVARCARMQPELTIAVALPKGPRQDVLVEKCTELGVAGLQPLRTDRSVASASEHKMGKWRRTAIEAAKQSGQSWLPAIEPLCTVPEVLAGASRFDCILMAATASDLAGTGVKPEAVAPLSALLTRLRQACRVLAFIGPEGGWTADESAAILQAGARPLTVGPHVLRIETAAMAIAAAVHAILHEAG